MTVNNNNNKPKSGLIESLTSNKKPACQSLADLVRQINEMSKKTNSSQSLEPEPPAPLAA